MANFHYRALNEQRQVVVGDVQADSVAHALSQLEALGLTVQSIGYAEAEPSAVAARPLPPGVSAEQMALRSHLERVLQRGQAMTPALRAFAAELPEGYRRRQLIRVLGVLERGDAAEASAALSELPEFWIPLLSAATVSNDAGRVLRQFLDESQRASELRRQWWQSLAYPLIIALLALGVMTVLSFLVVPVFRDIFMEFDLPLPRWTAFVLGVAAWIQSGRILIALAIAVAAVFLLWKLTALLPVSWQVWWGDRFGTPLGRTTAIARLAEFTADLLEAGLEVPDALRIAGFSTRSPRLQRAAWRLAREIDRNEGLPPLSRPDPLTQTIQHALRGAMPPPARIRLLREVGHCHAQRARRRLSWTRGLVEPIAICVIGLVVGGTVLALFMPLVYLIHGLSG